MCIIEIMQRPSDLESRRLFEALVVPYLAQGRKLAGALMRKDEDADDVLQEASLRAYRFVATCRADNPRAWFLTIVRNTAYSWLKSGRNDARMVSLDDPDRPGLRDSLADPETPESILLAEESLRRRREALRGLSAAHREVLALRDDHELSYSEISERIGVPTGTVMSRLARARAALERRSHVDPGLCALACAV